MKVLIAL